MKKLGLTLSLAFLVAGLGSPLLAGATPGGVVMEIEMRAMRANPPSVKTSKMLVASGSFRMEIQEADGPKVVIFRGDRKQLLVIKPANQEYMVVDQKMLSAVADKVGTAMSEVEKQLAELPPEQRAQLRQLMGSQGLPGAGAGAAAAPPAVPTSKLERSSEKKNIAGHDCVRYDVLQGSEKTQEIWVAEGLASSHEVLQTMKALADFNEQLTAPLKGMGSLAASGGIFSSRGNPFAEWGQLSGMPLWVRSFERGTLTHEMEIKTLREQAVEAAEFEPPAGFKQRQPLEP